MSYDPSHRTPPRQERWPQATPAEGWPPYRDGEEERAGRPGARAQQAAGSHRRQAAPRSGAATAVFPVTRDAYGTSDSYGTDGYRTGGYPGGTDAFDGVPAGYPRADLAHGQAASAPAADADGYGQARRDYAGGYGTAGYGYDSAPDGYPSGAAYLGPGSYTERTYAGSGYPGSGYSDAGYSGPGYSDPGYPGAAYSGPGFSQPGYSGPGYSEPGYSDSGYSEPGYSDSGYSEPGYSDSGYSEPGYSDPALTAPDAGVHPEGWQAEQARRRAASYRGPLVSAASELLATAVVIGVTTLAAGLLRSTVSPVSAMGTIFIDRTPAALRGFALHHFGTHGRTVLLLGMYAVIAVIAIAIGVAARRAAAFGVTGVAAFALVAAFVAVTRPASHVSDVMPAVIGGLAGVAALLWLVRASAPVQEVTPLRPARGGTRRRTR